MATKAKKTLVLVDGEKVPVLKEDGKWYVCGTDRRFRKLSALIAAVEEEKPEKVKEPKKEKSPVQSNSDGAEAKEAK